MIFTEDMNVSPKTDLRIRYQDNDVNDLIQSQASQWDGIGEWRKAIVIEKKLVASLFPQTRWKNSFSCT